MAHERLLNIVNTAGHGADRGAPVRRPIAPASRMNWLRMAFTDQQVLDGSSMHLVNSMKAW
jgi:hypothetical protein